LNAASERASVLFRRLINPPRIPAGSTGKSHLTRRFVFTRIDAVTSARSIAPVLRAAVMAEILASLSGD